MTTFGGNEGEMDDVGGLSEANLERILAGRAPADEDTAGLAQFAEDLRALYVTTPPVTVQHRHLAAIADAVRLHNTQTQPSAPPARRTARLATLLPTWRRKVVFSGFFGTLTAKILVGTVAAAAATGGLAAGNLLPAPVQGAVSGIAAAVGIDLPHGEETLSPSVVPANHSEDAVRILDALLMQITDAAQQPHAVGAPVAEAAQACATQVSAIAAELADAAQKSMDPAQALSLAQRATAIAQEAVGCALPKPADTDTSTGVAAPSDQAAAAVVSATSGAKPIVDAATECVTSMKPGIMQLARWWTAKMDPAAAMEMASKARGLAGSAGECASKVGTAAQTAFGFPMVAMPGMHTIPGMPDISKLPFKGPGTGPWPAVPTPSPTPDAPQADAPAASNPQPATNPLPAGAPIPAMTPSWWSAFMPGGTPGMIPGTTPGTAPGAGQATNPAAPWTGMTGSWGNLGQWMPAGPWNPFQPNPQASPTP